MSSCPHCGHKKSAKTSSVHSLSSQDDAASIQQEVVRLENLITKLTQERFSLLRRLNYLRSPTRNLPLETLSLIFQHAAPPIDISSRSLRFYQKGTCHQGPAKGTHIPVLLSSVCTVWRHVVQTTPQLWTSLVLDIPDEKSVASKVALLRLYLANTKGLSFSLELSLNERKLPVGVTFAGGRHCDPADFNLLRPFHHILIKPENALRMKVLRLSTIPPALSPLGIKDFPRLEELHVGYPYGCGEVDEECGASLCTRNCLPCFSHLLGDNFLAMPKLDNSLWVDNLTVVNLFAVPIIVCLEVLIRCRNVVEFRARKDSYNWRHAPRIPKLDKYVLPKLEVLEWACGELFHPDETLFHASLMNRIQTPALRVLAWNEGLPCRNQEWGGTRLTDFLNQLPSTVVEFEFIGIASNCVTCYRWFWRHLSNVRKLTFSEWPLCKLARVFDILTPNKRGVLGVATVEVPALKEISIVGCLDSGQFESTRDEADEGGEYEEDDEDEEDDAIDDRTRGAFLRMVEERMGLFQTDFKLNVARSNFFDWTLDDRMRMRQMTEKGCKLEVSKNGQLVQYLHDDTDEEYDDEE